MSIIAVIAILLVGVLLGWWLYPTLNDHKLTAEYYRGRGDGWQECENLILKRSRKYSDSVQLYVKDMLL